MVIEDNTHRIHLAQNARKNIVEHSTRVYSTAARKRVSLLVFVFGGIGGCHPRKKEKMHAIVQLYDVDVHWHLSK